MRNAIIIAAKRTGSTFLQECLNNHPNATCYDEMFMKGGKNGKQKRRGQFLYAYMKEAKNMNYKQYINWVFDNEGAICFRLMYPHLGKHKTLFNVINSKEIPIIHLIRKNYLEHYLSTQTKKSEKITINTDILIPELKKLKNRVDFHINTFNNNSNYIEVYYEDMIGEVKGKKKDVKNYGAFNLKSNQVTYLTDKYSEKICKFLKISNEKLYSNVTKRNSWNIWNHIQNDNKVKKTIGKSEFSYLIQ